MFMIAEKNIYTSALYDRSTIEKCNFLFQKYHLKTIKGFYTHLENRLFFCENVEIIY